MVEHRLAAGDTDLRDMRKLRLPRGTWWPLRIAWSIVTRNPIFVAETVLYLPRTSEVTDVQHDWATVATATDMFNRVREGCESIWERCDEEHPDALVWQDPESGCVVWVEKVFPRYKPAAAKRFRRTRAWLRRRRWLPSRWYRNRSKSLR